MGCGDYLVVLVLLVVYSCVAFTVVESAVVPLPESVLRWFGIAGEEAGSCGPQLEIATPACKVVETRKEYELRKYNTEIWVETLVGNSTFESATSTGFYRCFDFISGKNSEGMKIEMTSPIHITPAPHTNGYKVAFFVPSRFKAVKDLPTPQDSEVHIYQSKGAVKAVIGPFGGFPSDKDYEAKAAELKKALDKDGLKYDETTVLYAGYSSPFQFRNRKQEVHVNVVA
ncbi:hypothetical protein KC19_2G072300 [Ceratodon purpureus]|uniref:Uncharacterized protein n=1 Tax=Ceratodon purpureus TaxID=3225 RepID=A0A8T0ITZ0_CERPU|nr:hypothetical protein KC19_2G072300 [Ceratodon purpureus]